METINKTKLAVATGITGGFFYLGCVVVMLLTGKDGIVKVSNALFHGMDFSTIIRTDMSALESLIGLLGFMLLMGVLGYILALIYNRLNFKQ